METKKKRRKPRDLNALAFQIVEEASEPNKETNQAPPNGKNPAAVALGHLGGLKGGPARAKKLSEKERKEIARKAAKARWNK
jgi:hypothetical protein